MPMRLGTGTGAGRTGSAAITSFDPVTKIALVSVLDGAGANAADGTTVGIYVDGSGSAFATGTTTSGVASITCTGLDTTLGHSLVPKSSVVSLVVGASYAYAPTFGLASFTGSQAVRKTTGGLNPTGDNATVTFTVAGGAITGISASTVGANYEPLVWQTLTAAGAPTVAFRGQVQAKADGTLDWTTFSFTGTGHDGVALNAGTGYGGSTATGIITRKCTSFIIAFGIRQGVAPVSGEYLLNASNNILQSQQLTGFKLRTDLGNAGGLQYRGLDTANLSTVDIQDHIVAVDLKQAAYNSSPNPGQQIYLNGANVGPTPTFAPVVDGTAAGLIDMSNTNVTQMTIGAILAGTSGFLHADVAYAFIAWGLRARDSVTGQLPDFSNAAVRNRFLPGSINLTDGSGVTGRQPQVFMPGSSLRTGTNLGCGGNFGTIVGTF